MKTTTSRWLDGYWGRVMPTPAPGMPVTVGVHQRQLAGYEGVYAIERHGHAHISSPVHVISDLVVRAPDRDEVMSPQWWKAFLPGWSVLGPSIHSFVDEPGSLPCVTSVRPAQLDEVHSLLRSRVQASEWEEAGFASDDIVHAWVLTGDDGVPVAAANLTMFDGLPVDVGVLTAADARGRGYARGVAGAAVRWALDNHGIARWRALESNQPSRRLAAALGFNEDTRQLAVRPGH